MARRHRPTCDQPSSASAGGLALIYKNAQAYFTGVELSPEIHDILGRLVATDDEIAHAQEENGPVGVFADQAEFGMSEARWKQYVDDLNQGFETAHNALLQDVLEPIREQEQEAYQQEREKVRARTEATIDQRPDFTAIRHLRAGVWPDGTPIPEEGPRFKLDKQDIIDTYGKERLDQLPGPKRDGVDRPNAGKPLYTDERGMRVDEAAEILGYPSGDDLLTALASAPDHDQLVESETDHEMGMRYPDPMKDGTIEDKARLAVVNDQRLRSMEAEAEAIARMRGRPATTKGLTDAGQAAVDADAKRVADEKWLSEWKERVARERWNAQQEADEKEAAILKRTAEETRAGKAAQAAKDEAKRVAENAATARTMSVAPDQVLKAVALAQIAKMKVRDLNPETHRSAMAKAGKKAAAEVVAARFETGEKREQHLDNASVAKQQERLNAHLYRAGKEAMRVGDKDAKFLKTFGDKAKRAKMGKAGGDSYVVSWKDATGGTQSREFSALDHVTPDEDGVLRTSIDAPAAARGVGDRVRAQQNGGEVKRSGPLEQIDAILEQFSLSKVSPGKLQEREQLRDYVARMEQEQRPIQLPESLNEILQQTNWKDLTVQQQRDVSDTVRNLQRIAFQRVDMMAARKGEEFAVVRSQVVDTLKKNGRLRTAEAVGRSPLHNLVETFGNVVADSATVQRLIYEMDGFKEGGFLFDTLRRPITDAGNDERHMQVASTKALSEIWKTWGKDNLGDPLLSIRHMQPAIGKQISHWGRIKVAHNWGNAEGRDRIMKGHGWSEDQVQSLLAGLDAKDMEFVQGILDRINTYWPEIKAKQKRVVGIAPEKVEAIPIISQHGIFKGGYFPIKYDPATTPKDFQDHEQAKLQSSGASLYASTRRGHTESRTGAPPGAQVLLDPSVITGHINQVIHYLAFHETLQDLNRLMRDTDVQATFRGYWGRQDLPPVPDPPAWMSRPARRAKPSARPGFRRPLAAHRRQLHRQGTQRESRAHAAGRPATGHGQGGSGLLRQGVGQDAGRWHPAGARHALGGF